MGMKTAPLLLFRIPRPLLRLRPIQVDLETDNLGAGADGRHNGEEQKLSVKSIEKSDHAPLNHSVARRLLTILLLCIQFTEQSIRGVVLRSGRPFRASCGGLRHGATNRNTMRLGLVAFLVLLCFVHVLSIPVPVICREKTSCTWMCTLNPSVEIVTALSRTS